MEKSFISAAEIREKIAVSGSEARCFISGLFDEGTFLEIGTYIKNTANSSNLEGVITGCGAVDGRLVFTFIQDYSNSKAGFTAASAQKIVSLYKSALKAKAPVVGVYSSSGAVLSEGIDAVSGYGSVIAEISKAKNTVPQISVIAGACGGAAAVAAAMADFTVADSKNGELYILPENDENQKQGVKAELYAEGYEALATEVKKLINFLPQNSDEGTVYTLAPDDINVPSYNVEALINEDVRKLVAEISDNREFYELASDKAKEMVCGFSSVNGKVIGIVANQPTENDGALTSCAAKKAAKFVDFLGRFKIPVLTLVNTSGFGGKSCSCYPSSLAKLSAAYTECTSSKITVVIGKAYGSAFSLLGSKRLGADLVFALDSAVISVMAPESAVEFVWNDKIKAADDVSSLRAELKNEWINTAASPLSAARLGDIDDVISFSELKQRIAAGFEVLN